MEMDPNEIELKSIDKLFEYEKQSRFIDSLEENKLKQICKLYCKLYLQQQEILSSIISL